MKHYQTKYIILNGPAHSGKSTIARELCSFFRTVKIDAFEDSFAAPIKHYIATAIGEKYSNMPKDSPVAILAGKSIRDFVINQSDYMKQEYGDDIYGRLLVNRTLRRNPKPYFVVADSSNDADELDALRDDAILIRIERAGYNFKRDSRQYLDRPLYTLKNNGNLADLWIAIEKLGLWIMEQYPNE